MHVRISDQLAKCMQPLDRFQRAVFHQTALIQYRRRFEPIPRQRPDQGSRQCFEGNHTAPPARADPVEAGNFEKTPATGI